MSALAAPEFEKRAPSPVKLAERQTETILYIPITTRSGRQVKGRKDSLNPVRR